MAEHSIKAIIFDVWNTLIKENQSYELVVQVLSELGIKATPEKFTALFDKHIFVDGLMPDFESLGKALEIEIDEVIVQKMIQLESLARSAQMTYPHTIAMLSSLKKQGYKIAFLSNSSENEIDRIKKYTSIMNYADVQIYSSTAGIRKPNPQIYLKTLETLETSPEETLMIGDSYEQDYLAPKEVGMEAIQFTTVEALKDSLKEYNISWD